VHGDFLAQALAALPQVYAPDRGSYHYRSMAKTNYRYHLQADQVRIKKKYSDF
jgi:uncharacterized protein